MSPADIAPHAPSSDGEWLLKLWHDLTSAGDSALLLPLLGWMFVWLVIPRSSRAEGWRWLIAVVACAGIVSASKLLFMAWGVGLPGLDYTGFSGHSALSALVWPSMAALLARRGSAALQKTAVGLGVLLALGIAISRVLLKAHSISEVVLGCALGLALAGWFLLSRAVTPKPSPRALALLAGMAILLTLAFYGRVFPSQHVLKQVALAISGRGQVFRRLAPLP